MSDTDFGSLGEPLDRTQARVRVAARALGNNDLGHAFGHVSARIDAENFLVCAPKPMGLIATGEPGTIVPIDGPLPDGVLGEVRCHQQIYNRRPEVNGIARTFLRDVMTLSTFQRKPNRASGSRPILPPAHRFGTTRCSCGTTPLQRNSQTHSVMPAPLLCAATGAF